jgi:hypothetical protein
MSRSVSILLAMSALLVLPGLCHAQPDLVKRIKKVTEVPIWQRKPITKKELQKAMKDLQSQDKQTMQDAYELVALSRPIPAYADVTVGTAQTIARQSKDKFAMAMTFEIRRDWNEAKQAAQTLQTAQRAGGMRYLEQILARGNASQVGAPMIAVAYSGNSRAGAVLVQYWRKSKIPGIRALLILGPPAADGLARQLNDPDEFVRKDVITVLGKIGTEKQVPQLQKLAEGSRDYIRRLVTEAIEKIEAREAEAKKQQASSKKKKPKKK